MKKILRRCALTRELLPRTALFRIVRTPQGAVMLDRDGTALGRGMHLKKDWEVIKAIATPKKKGLWQHLLKCPIADQTQQEICVEMENILSQ